MKKNFEYWDLGRAEFNAGRFYEAHKFWEEIWVHAKGQEKSHMQGLIIFCGILIHIEKGNLDVAKRLAINCQKKITNPNLFKYRIQGLEKFLKLVSEELWSKVKLEMTLLRAAPQK